MVVIDVVIELEGVIQRAITAGGVTGQIKEYGVDDRCLARSKVGRIRFYASNDLASHGRIERPEEEQVIARSRYVASYIGAHIIVLLMQQFSLLIYACVVGLAPRGLKCLRTSKPI